MFYPLKLNSSALYKQDFTSINRNLQVTELSSAQLCQSDFCKMLLFSFHAINPNSRTQTTNLKLLKWHQTRKLFKMQPLIIWTRIYESGLGQRINVLLSVKTFVFNSKKSKSDTWWSVQGIAKDHTIRNILRELVLEFWRQERTLLFIVKQDSFVQE